MNTKNPLEDRNVAVDDADGKDDDDEKEEADGEEKEYAKGGDDDDDDEDGGKFAAVISTKIKKMKKFLIKLWQI